MAISVSSNSPTANSDVSSVPETVAPFEVPVRDPAPIEAASPQLNHPPTLGTHEADATDTNDYEGTDSVLGDGDDFDTSSYATSLLSQVRDYSYENGRRYYSYRQGEYIMPNDEDEQERQDLLHHVRNLALRGALFLPPIEKASQRVLDIGTGTVGVAVGIIMAVTVSLLRYISLFRLLKYLEVTDSNPKQYSL
jgi:hypothetical protein